MQLRLSLLIPAAVGAMLCVPATASAYFVHVVGPGESLSSIATQDGLSVAALAAANGLSPDTQLQAGSTIQIPPQGASVVAPSTTEETGEAGSTAVPASTSTSGAYVVQAGRHAVGDRRALGRQRQRARRRQRPEPELVPADRHGSSSRGLGLVRDGRARERYDHELGLGLGGSYVVQAGDTLSAIAARAGESVNALAAANGLDPNKFLITGTVLRVPAGSASGSAVDVSMSSASSDSNAATSQPVGGPAQGVPTDPPYPTPERVTASEVGSVAAANGVPSSLADAIAWQESGFNNDLVSSADARGVMQILPGTWEWIQHSLDTGGPPLTPASAADNVRGGVLLLHSLLGSTGGDEAMAAAGYYQGLPSVMQNGVYPSTQNYVNSVLALQSQFGGGG